MTFKRILLGVLGVLAVGFVLIQLVPLGRDHTNPPVVSEPNWDSPETAVLVERACADCHSNETNWPWYSNIAPVSWLVSRDVVEGREYLNFSEWGGNPEGEEAEELVEVIQSGEMPMPIYLITHPEARLTDAEREQLMRGLVATATGQSADNVNLNRVEREHGEEGEYDD